MNDYTAREKLARFLCERQNGSRGWDYEPGRRYWLEDAEDLLPVVREIAAEELREAADGLAWDGLLHAADYAGYAAKLIHDRAAALHTAGQQS